MDFDGSCAVVQGCLRSVEKSIGIKLLDISSSAEHDDYVQKVIQKLKSALAEFEPETVNLKKLHILILLNSDFPNIKLLSEDKSFCHILEIIPKMSRYLYFQIVSQMSWENYLSQVVINFPEIIVYDVIESINDNLNYIEAEYAIPFFYAVIDGLFTKILQIQNICKYRTQKLVKLCVPLVQYKIDEQNDDNIEAKYHYLGYIVRMYLNLVISSVKKLLKPEFIPDTFYDTKIDYSYSQWGATVSSTSNWGYYCLRFLAVRAVEIVKMVNVDIYISWTEVDIKDAVNKTLQMSVRETAFICQETLRSIQHLYDAIPGLSSLDKCLSSIAVRPITEDDEIREADANTIVMNLLNPKRTQIKWLRGLIEKGVFESPTFMKVVTDNSSLMDYDTALLLINKAFDYLTTNSLETDAIQLIRNTTLISIKSLKESDQILLLTKLCDHYTNKAPMLGEDFDERATQFFNRLVHDESKKQEYRSEMVALAFESRDLLLNKALDECLTSIPKASCVLDMLEHVYPICLIISENTGLPQILSNLLSLMESSVKRPENIQDNFIHLVKSISEKKLINPACLLYNHLVPILERCHLNQIWTKLNFYLEIVKVLQSIVKPRNIKFISIIAKILNTKRPKVKNFKYEDINITDKCIYILTNSIQNILRSKTADDEEMIQLRELGSNLSALTWQYMMPLWKNWGHDLPSDEHGLLLWTQPGFGHGESLNNLNNEIRLHLVTSSVKILPQLVACEWERIGGVNIKNTELLIATYLILADCVLIWFQVPFMLTNILLLGNNVTNFLNFTQKIIIPRLKNAKNDQVDQVIYKLDQIMEQIPDELSKSKMADLIHLKKEASSKKQLNHSDFN